MFKTVYLIQISLLMLRKHNYKDQKLIDMRRIGNESEKNEAFEIIYLNHKEYCTGFMRKIFGERKEIVDIYQDAVLILIENIHKPGWSLTCSIQTYLNTVCRNQGLTKFGKNKISYNLDEISEQVSDTSLPFEESINDERIRIIVEILNNGTKTTIICKEILVRRFYENKSHEEIAKDLGYENADVVKQTHSRCLKKLKVCIK